jgi:hypothetical protein
MSPKIKQTATAVALALFVATTPAAMAKDKPKRDEQRHISTQMRGGHNYNRNPQRWYDHPKPIAKRFHGMDRNGDGVVTRKEWRGNDRSFRIHDRNGDGVLSGDEIR